MAGICEGRVVIVTGAGRGIGRAHALEFARQGAKVVVNDIGVELDGAGGGSGPAGEVVEAIRAAGGEAVANGSDVADFKQAGELVKTAIDSFGGLDVVVNNAGIVRDRMFVSCSEEEWDAVIRVHLKGHFCTTRFATAYWREQGKAKGGPVYGRIINTASEAFIFGSAGQPNYAAAKAGIVALTMATAQSMVKYGVTANVIMPRARTRMTDTGMTAAIFAKPEESIDNFAPEHVSPLVNYLASPQAARISGKKVPSYNEGVGKPFGLGLFGIEK